MNKQIQSIRNDLSENKLERAFEIILSMVANKQDLHNQALTLMARFKEIRKQEIIGAIGTSESLMFRAQLNFSVLNLVNIMESDIQDLNQRAVFISYSHADHATANRLKEKLVGDGIPVIIDSEKLKGGQDIRSFINQSIRDTSITLSIISKKSILSSWVTMETITSFQHEKFTNAPKLIACYIDNDFFQRSFTDEIIDLISNEIANIGIIKKKRIDKGLSTRDLDNEFTRWNDLKNNIDEIVRRLRESLCIDVSDLMLDANFPKIMKALQGLAH